MVIGLRHQAPTCYRRTIIPFYFIKSIGSSLLGKEFAVTKGIQLSKKIMNLRFSIYERHRFGTVVGENIAMQELCKPSF
jgi:hypothetical protein